MPLRAGSFQKTAPKPPYGLSFPLDDLVEAKEWTERLQFSLFVVLDHVIEGVEFEEVVVIGSADNRQRILTIWNTGASIHAQAPNGRPRSYPTMAQALDSACIKSSSTKAARQPWRFFHSS